MTKRLTIEVDEELLPTSEGYYSDSRLVVGKLYRLAKEQGYVLKVSSTMCIYLGNVDYFTLEKECLTGYNNKVESSSNVISEETLLKAIALTRTPELGVHLFK